MGGILRKCSEPVPKNVISTGPCWDQNYKPRPGYKWVEPCRQTDLRVVWSPNQKHPQARGIISSETEGHWKPAPGYEWLNSIKGDLRVKPKK